MAIQPPAKVKSQNEVTRVQLKVTLMEVKATWNGGILQHKVNVDRIHV